MAQHLAYCFDTNLMSSFGGEFVKRKTLQSAEECWFYNFKSQNIIRPELDILSVVLPMPFCEK